MAATREQTGKWSTWELSDSVVEVCFSNESVNGWCWSYSDTELPPKPSEFGNDAETMSIQSSFSAGLRL